LYAAIQSVAMSCYAVARSSLPLHRPIQPRPLPNLPARACR